MKKGILYTIIAVMAISLVPAKTLAWEGNLDSRAIPTQWDFYQAFEQDGQFQGVSLHARNEFDEPRSTTMIQEEIDGQTVISIYAVKNTSQNLFFTGESPENIISYDMATDGVQRKSWREDGASPTGFTFFSASETSTPPQTVRAIYFGNSIAYGGSQEDASYPTYTYTPPEVIVPPVDPPEEESPLNTGYFDANAQIDTRFLDNVAIVITLTLTLYFAYQFRWRGRRE